MKHSFKKHVSLLLSLMMVLGTLVAFPFSAVAEVTPTEGWKVSDGISSAADMLAFAAAVAADTTETPYFAGETVELKANVDLNGVAWTPISTFNGTFEGNGYTVSNLTITSTASKTAFVSVTNGATFKNVSFVGGTVTGYSSVGTVVGKVEKGTATFENVYVNATVVATDAANAGGILGYVEADGDAVLKNCVSKSTVGSTATPKNGMGGFVGYTELGGSVTATDCAFLGTCIGEAWSGGIIGYNRGDATMTRCVSLGTVTAGTTAGSMISMYSDRAKTWNPANAALTADPNADISQYVGKIKFVDCYYTGTAPLHRHTNKYFNVFDIDVEYTDGTVVDLSGVPDGYMTDALAAEQADAPYAAAMKKIDTAAFDYSALTLLANWVQTGTAEVMPASVAKMLGICPIPAEFNYQVATTENADGTINVRFVAVIDDLRYANVGFNVQATRTNGVDTKTSAVIPVTATGVYTTINALGQPISASTLGGKYIVAVVINDIDYQNWDHSFAISAFVTMQDGTVLTTATKTAELSKKVA